MNDDESWLGIDLSGRQPKITGGIGHNSDVLVRAKSGLLKVAEGHMSAIEGWLEFGEALNEGRAMFSSDELFGQWVSDNLSVTDFNDHERIAAMWAAEDIDRFYEVKLAYPKARTVRGLHAKWKKDQIKTEWQESHIQRQQLVLDGLTVLADMHSGKDEVLIEWAKEHDLFVSIDRDTDWGNPFKVGQDGSRDEVIDRYRYHLEGHPHLMERLKAGELSGKVLGCWCYPHPCHGDVLIEYVYAQTDADNGAAGRAHRKIVVPPYSINRAMGAISGLAELYCKSYTGTVDCAAEVLIAELMKGTEDAIGISIARDRIKWLLQYKSIMDNAEPELRAFLDANSELKTVD